MDNAPMLLSRDIKIYAHSRYGTLSPGENMVFVLNSLGTLFLNSFIDDHATFYDGE